MNYKKIMNKLNEKNTAYKTVFKLLNCPHCGSIDITTTEQIEDIYYYRETDDYKYLEEYEGQRPIGITIAYNCDICNTDFIFTGKLTDTKIEVLK